MRFRAQLIALLAVELVLVLVICASAIIALGVTRDASRRTTASLGELGAVQQLDGHIDRMSNDARGFLITGDPRYVAWVRTWQRELASLASELGAADPRGSAEAPREDLRALVRNYSQAVDLAILDRSNVAQLTALEQLFEQLLVSHRNALDVALQDVVQRSQSSASDAAVHGMQIADTASILIGVGAVLAIVLTIMLGVLVARRLAVHLDRIQESRRVASEEAAGRQQLLDIVSHDLRAPLNTITLGLDALREEHADLPLIQPIENAARRMQRLVDDLLAAARAQTIGLQLHLERIDCHELLQQAVEAFAERAERAGVKLEIENSLHSPVHVDRDRVLQILSNLVGNALKVTPRGGSITLAAHPTEIGVRFSVHDSGPGLEADQVPLLFEAYRQGKSPGTASRSGLGLGLYISKTLTQAHGGTIGVDTATADGSTFWFELPRSHGARTPAPTG